MKCPKCGSDAAYRNGHNTRKDGSKVPKIYCPTCGKSSQAYRSPPHPATAANYQRPGVAGWGRGVSIAVLR